MMIFRHAGGKMDPLLVYSIESYHIQSSVWSPEEFSLRVAKAMGCTHCSSYIRVVSKNCGDEKSKESQILPQKPSGSSRAEAGRSHRSLGTQ